MKRLALQFIVLTALSAGAKAADPPLPSAAVPGPANLAPGAGNFTPAPPSPPSGAPPGAAPSADSASTPPAAEPPPLPPTVREPEELLSADLARRPVVGKAIQLKVGQQNVLGLYTEQTTRRTHGALLLLHDLGGHADWPGTIGELRRGLPSLGWNTLSIQLPVAAHRSPEKERAAFLDQSVARIDAALAYLQASGLENIVLAGHGLGAVAALEYSLRRGEELAGLVLLSLPHAPHTDPRLDTVLGLSRLQGPVLDLYAAADLLEVVNGAEARRAAGGANIGYSDIALPGADHFFRGQEQILVRRVRGWLDRHVTGKRLVSTVDEPVINSKQPQVTP